MTRDTVSPASAEVLPAAPDEIARLKAAYYDCMVVVEQAQQRMQQINARLRELAAEKQSQ